MTPADSTPRRASFWVVLVCGLVYAAGVALLALAVYVDLPGPLSAYGDLEASWPILVQVVTGVTAFGTWRWRNRRATKPFAVVLLALGIATVIVLASASYAACPDVGLSRGWSVVSRVVGLVTNNYAVDMFKQPGCQLGGPPLALQFARLAQLAVLLVAATSAVTALLRNQVDRLAVRWSRRVSLVVGADSTSSALLPALASGSESQTLAVLTPDPLAPWLGQARAAGWRVVVADPRDEAALSRLLIRGRRRHALRRLALLAPDSTEAQRLMSAVQHVIGDRRPLTGREPVRALLRMDEAWQAEDWRRRYLSRIPEWIVDTISQNEVTARLLVDDLLEQQVDHLLVVGHSDLTFAIVAELAQRSRERDLRQDDAVIPSVTLLGPDAGEVLEEHVLAQSRFGNTRLDAVTAKTDVDVEDEVAGAVRRHTAPALVFSGDVCVPDQRLATRLGATYPTLVLYSRHDEVAGLGAEPLLARVRAFGSTLDAGRGSPVDNWERIARLVHEDFIRTYPDPEDPARRPWDELEPFYRESNVRQVLTVLGSAVAVGRSWGASGATATPVSPEQLDQMAQREQESWRDHLEHNGWRWAATRDREARTHPDLLPWEELAEASRDKTRNGVTDILGLLTTLGYRSFDDPFATWHRLVRRGEVTAVRRTSAWTWTVSDGTVMHGDAGDWEVTDESGSRSVTPSIFEATHEHVEGDRWRRVGEVRGRRARPGEVIHSLEGDQTAGDDQWVLRGVEGEEWLVSSDHVASAYERVPESPATAG